VVLQHAGWTWCLRLFTVNNKCCSEMLDGGETLRHYATIRKVVGSRPDGGERIFSIYLAFPAALGRGAYSAYNRNEYQKQKSNVSGE
jgi:hypothetical protein